MQNIKD